ncbi:MAG: hypothetical protein AB7U98_08295 [Candidatus Nitrosocosmicus sp.]
MAAKVHDDTTNFRNNVDYEAMILNIVKSNDLQDIGIITLILEDILCIKDKDNQYFGLFKDDISSIKDNKEVILKKNYSDILESKINLPGELYKPNSIIEVELDLVTKGKIKRKRKGLFSFITGKIRSDSPTVFSNDGQKVGQLYKASEYYLTILSFNEHGLGFEYKVKTSHIEEYDGWKIVLDLPFNKVETIMQGQKHMVNNALSGSKTTISPTSPSSGSGGITSSIAGLGVSAAGGGARRC